jgi:hypothetical protein
MYVPLRLKALWVIVGVGPTATESYFTIRALLGEALNNVGAGGNSCMWEAGFKGEVTGTMNCFMVTGRKVFCHRLSIQYNRSASREREAGGK